MIGKYTCEVKIPDSVRDIKAEMAFINYYGHLKEAVLVPVCRECTIDIPVKEFSEGFENFEATTAKLQPIIESVYGKGALLTSCRFTCFEQQA